MFKHIALLMCDMQLKVLPHIKNSNRLLTNVNTLLQANKEYRKTTDNAYGNMHIHNTHDNHYKRVEDYPDIICGYYGDLGHSDYIKNDHMSSMGVPLSNSRIGTYAPIGLAELLPKKLGPTSPLILNNMPQKDTFIWEKPHYSMFDHLTSQKFKKLGVDTILLTGVQTEWCIMQTALDYKKDGYNVVVISDAVGSTSESEHIHALKRLRSESITVNTCHGWIVDRLRISDHPLTKWYVNRLKVQSEIDNQITPSCINNGTFDK